MPVAALNGWLAAVVLLTWMIAMVVLMGFFQGHGLGNQQLVRFAAAELPAAPAADRPLVMYFLAEGCACGRNADRRIEQINRRYGGAVQQWISTGADADRTGPPATVMSAAMAARWRAHVPAFPAVAVWDAQGALQYFGALEAGPDCGGVGNGYLVASLARLSDGQPRLNVPEEMVGCLCPAGNGAADNKPVSKNPTNNNVQNSTE